MDEDEPWKVKDPLGLAGFEKRLEPDDPNVEKLPKVYIGTNDPIYDSTQRYAGS